MTDWFRSWHGAPTDNKWLVIAKKAGVAPGVVSAVMWALLDHASQNDSRGFVGDFDVETYSIFSGFEEAGVMAVIAALEDKGVIVDGRLGAWEKRQPKREDNSTSRVTKHREERRNASKRGETQRNAPEKSREDTDNSEANASAPAEPSPALISPKDRVWSKVLDLVALSGRAESQTRKFLGKALSEFDADIVERAVMAALAEGSGDPFAFITRCLKPAQGQARASPRYSDPNSFESFDPDAIVANLKARQAAKSETVQ